MAHITFTNKSRGEGKIPSSLGLTVDSLRSFASPIEELTVSFSCKRSNHQVSILPDSCVRCDKIVKKNSLKECVFINSTLKLQFHIVKVHS